MLLLRIRKASFLIPFKVLKTLKIKFYGMLAQLLWKTLFVYYVSLDFLLDFISSKYIQRRNLF